METPPPFAPGERVKITFEVGDGELHVHSGEFIKLDETGLMYQAQRLRVIRFIPRERVVMIEGAS